MRKRFGTSVRRLRQQRGWTQEDLAGRLTAVGLPTHQTTIAKLESGSRPTSLEEVEALTAIFRVNLSTLLGRHSPVGELGLAQNELAQTEVERARRYEDLLLARVQTTAAQAAEANIEAVLEELDARIAELQLQVATLQAAEQAGWGRTTVESVRPIEGTDFVSIDLVDSSGERRTITVPGDTRITVDRPAEVSPDGEPADPDAANQVADFLGDFGISMTAVPVEGEAVEGDGEHQETA